MIISDATLITCNYVHIPPPLRPLDMEPIGAPALPEVSASKDSTISLTQMSESRYKPAKKGISKKMLGLGVGAGFLGGAALGVAGTMASYSVYHKYQVGWRQGPVIASRPGVQEDDACEEPRVWRI